jgi:diacylglycerol kinase (ATP)
VETEQGARHYLNVAGAGFDSIATARGDRMRLLGRHRYSYAAMETLVWFKPVPFRLTVDGTPHELPARFVAVGNGPAYGGGMRITPGATYHDGMLEACAIGALSRLDFVRMFRTVYTGTHTRHPDVHVFRGRTMTVESDPGYDVFADGERVGTGPARFSCLPSALSVLVPGGLAGA